MKKKMACAALASVMALSMTACSSSEPAETAAAETEAAAEETEAEAEETEAAAEETEAAAEGENAGGTLIVGFDQDFPPMGFVGDDENLRALIWPWQRKWRTASALSTNRSRLPGMPRIWSWNPATLTASGTDLRLRDARTITPGRSRIWPIRRFLSWRTDPALRAWRIWPARL